MNLGSKPSVSASSASVSNLSDRNVRTLSLSLIRFASSILTLSLPVTALMQRSQMIIIIKIQHSAQAFTDSSEIGFG